jgi:hypothetical protein
MADRRSRRDRHQVQLDYAFDRLLGTKLQQIYELLVPDQVRIVGDRSKVMENGNADRGDLRKGVLRQAARGGHDRQPDGGAKFQGYEERRIICADGGLRVAGMIGALHRASSKPK